MNNNMPIERLNYFNGQRLEAADFRIEQEFHIRTRRLLTQALFTPGIATGLAVEKVVPEPSHAVRVLSGVAIDSLGREIILVEPRDVPVAGNPTEPADPVIGNYLVIEYGEKLTAFAGDGCAVQLGVTCKATEDLAWGDTSRIRAEPQLYIQHQWPKPTENKIVLAQLELDLDCSVREIRAFVRKYASGKESTRARALAFEGEKDIDSNNPKNLYFHIEGDAPSNVTLILRGARFSTLFYTELGDHAHGLDIKLKDFEGTLKHSHHLAEEITIPESGEHPHAVSARLGDVDDVASDELGCVEANPFTDEHDKEMDLVSFIGMKVSGGAHTHQFSGADIQTDEASLNLKHTHEVVTTATKHSGMKANGQGARTGSARNFIDDLQIAFDNQDITELVLVQLKERDGAGIWDKLGDGTASHRLTASDAAGKVEGTGKIDLLRLGIDLAPSEHRLTFSVPQGEGGQIQYNLYIE
jgi:hypothetical protein